MSVPIIVRFPPASGPRARPPTTRSSAFTVGSGPGSASGFSSSRCIHRIQPKSPASCGSPPASDRSDGMTIGPWNVTRRHAPFRNEWIAVMSL